MTHLLGIVGLSLSFSSALVLLKVPGGTRYTAEGNANLGHWASRPADEKQRRQWQRKHYIQKWSYRGALVMLYVGFALQAYDLVRSQ